MIRKTYRRVELRLVRETADRPYEIAKIVRSGEDVVGLLKTLIGGKPQEEFYAVFLDARHRVIGVHQVSRGTVDGTSVHPRDVFGPALSLSASAIVVAHNHPSADLHPSTEDRQITARLRSAGDLLGIPLLDHLILSENNFYSFAASEGNDEPW